MGALSMTYIVGMVSQKGGVGKSTLARMMAREFVAGGMATKIADLDTQQQTCTHWAGRRAENNIDPEIQVQSFASVKSALEEAERFDALILDGKPNASEQTIEIAKAADLVVIPTGQTVDDLHPGVVLAHSLKKKGISPEKIAFAMFKTTGSERENTAAREYISQAGYMVLEGEVGVSTAYGSASDQGRAITETSFRSLNERASKVAQSVIDRMAELQERKVA
ncbi:ParA family protein [Gluconobacter cerinus]|uniref:ParA family protein n=1 Tax=Gluconobacter cerinus TaxID=38307 RepID=UPI0031FEEF6D